MVDNFTEAIQNTLTAMSTGLKYPVMIILIILAGTTVFILGTLIVEAIQEHRHLNVKMPLLIEDIRKAGKGNIEECIKQSGLLKRQKAALIEITKHPDLSDMERESLAVRLITEEQDHYDRKTKRTDLIAKVGPMLGLMGTLIPLGPGVIALGQGDTYTLSNSLLIAFNTTVAGLACAAVALCVSVIRKRWYNNYMSMLETLMECILDEENTSDRSTLKLLQEMRKSLETVQPASDRQNSQKPKRQLTDEEKAVVLKALREHKTKQETPVAPEPVGDIDRGGDKV